MTIIEIAEAVGAVIGGLIGTGALNHSIKTKKQNNQLHTHNKTLSERIVVLETYNKTNHNSFKEIKNDIQFIKKWIIEQKGGQNAK